MDAMTGWLSDDEQAAWRGLLQMTAHLNAWLNRELQEGHGLSLADYEVLVRLSDTAEARLRVYELAQELQWEQSRLSHHLARMQRRGLVAREGCPNDGRGAFIALTDTGRDAHDGHDARPGPLAGHGASPLTPTSRRRGPVFGRHPLRLRRGGGGVPIPERPAALLLAVMRGPPTGQVRPDRHDAGRLMSRCTW